MRKIVENGIVGYFDILGYQNFLKNNSIEKCIDVIEKIILELPEEIKKDYLGLYSDIPDEYLRNIRNHFKTNLNITFISDTIIFFFDFDGIENDSIPAFLNQILFFLMVFTWLSFEKGFPMRGYVDYGEFYYNDENNKSIIAGKTIINCHQQTNNLDFSGLVIDENTCKFCKSFDYFYLNYIFEKKIIDKYLVDTKNGEEEKYVLNAFLDIDKLDLTQYIFDCFHKYNKEINNEVMKKIRNTEKIMRHFVFNNNQLNKQ
jgi:hypothetical protein